MSQIRYKRILLKLSGEALMGEQTHGIDPTILNRVAAEIKDLVSKGVEVGIVIGGGNIFRGAGLAEAGIDRVTGDHMGMLATVMNALAMGDALRSLDVDAHVMSAFAIGSVCEMFDRRLALSYLQQGQVVLFSAGTGNPFFTTDTAASLRAIEIKADLMLKATKVDGVYSADPKKYPDATRYSSLSYDDVLAQGLAVMDATAIVLCRDNKMPLRVFDMTEEGNLQRLILGEELGTVVH